jgi:hypothetical protein
MSTLLQNNQADYTWNDGIHYPLHRYVLDDRTSSREKVTLGRLNKEDIRRAPAPRRKQRKQDERLPFPQSIIWRTATIHAKLLGIRDPRSSSIRRCLNSFRRLGSAGTKTREYETAQACEMARVTIIMPCRIIQRLIRSNQPFYSQPSVRGYGPILRPAPPAGTFGITTQPSGKRRASVSVAPKCVPARWTSR